MQSRLRPKDLVAFVHRRGRAICLPKVSLARRVPGDVTPLGSRSAVEGAPAEDDCRRGDGMRAPQTLHIENGIGHPIVAGW